MASGQRRTVWIEDGDHLQLKELALARRQALRVVVDEAIKEYLARKKKIRRKGKK